MAKVNTKAVAASAATGAQKYLVVRPWFGVKKGDVITKEKLHPSLKANVMRLSEGTLTPATPAAGTTGQKAPEGQDKGEDKAPQS